MTADLPRWPKVTVTVLAFHTADTSVACVRSVLAADYPGEIEVLVREQGGDDAEHEALAGCSSVGHRAVMVSRGPNLGFCGGHNRLLGQASGELVLLLNADARLDPGFLRAAVPAFAASDVAAVQGLVLRDDDSEVVDTTGLAPSRSRRIVARDQGRRWTGQRAPGPVWGVDGAVALFRMGALRDAELTPGEVLPEAFGSYKEDVELAWRLRRLGWEARFEPAARAWHRRSARGSDLDDQRPLARWRERRRVPARAHVQGFVNLRLTQVRHEQPRELGRDLGPWVRREVLAWAALVLTPVAFVRSLAGLARGLPASVRARRGFTARIRAVDDAAWFR